MLGLATVLLCLATLHVPIQALDGQRFPIPKEDLYENYTKCNHGSSCVENPTITEDYTCRYSGLTKSCYCCGAFFHYTEQGKVCTKYCDKSQDAEQNRYCQPRLIVLPFNWGDHNPDKITLDDGSRWREETQVKFPYDNSAPQECPQDPMVKQGEIQETPRSYPGRSPIPTTLKVTQVQTTGQCKVGETCVPAATCPAFKLERDGLKLLQKNSARYKKDLQVLKSKVCDKKTHSVCCEEPARPRQVPRRRNQQRTSSERPRVPRQWN